MRRYFNFNKKEFLNTDVIEGFDLVQGWYCDKMNREIFELSINKIDAKKNNFYKEYIDSFNEEEVKEEEVAESYNNAMSILSKG